MKSAYSGLIALWLAAILAITIWLAHARLVALQHNWSLNDWLINYDGGFVRRGLFGAMIQPVPAPPEWVVFAVVVLAHLIFLWCVFRLTLATNIHPGLVLFLACPALLLFPLQDPDGAFRKEILLYAFLAAFLWRVQNRRSALWILAFLPAIILSHEALIAFVPALLLPLSFLRLNAVQWAWIGFIALASLLAFAASIIINVDQAQVAQICEGLAQSPSLVTSAERCSHDGAISWLVHDTAFGRARVAQLAEGYLAELPLALCLMGVPILACAGPICRFARAHPAHLRWALLGLGINIAIWVPLFFVATDWGRLLSMELTVIWLLVLFAAAHADLPPPRAVLIPLTLVAAVLYGSSWKLVHWRDLLAPGAGLQLVGLADADAN